MSGCYILICTVFVLLLTSTTALVRSMNEKQYSLIQSYMNASVDPCTDFYQYACGNWETVHANDNDTNDIESMNYAINKDYENILKTRKQKLLKQHRFVRQVIAYYKSCRSETMFAPQKYINKFVTFEGLMWPNFNLGASQFFMHLSKQKSEGNSSNSSPYWLKMLATLRNYGLNNIFISEVVIPNMNDTSQYVVSIDRPMLKEDFVTLDELTEGLAESNEEKVKQFKTFEEELLELFDIEDEDGFDILSLSKINISEIKPYLEIVLNTTEIDVGMKIGIDNRAYLHALFNFLRNYDDKFICEYLSVRFLMHIAIDAPTGFTDKSCITKLRKRLPSAMAWLYEQQHPELSSETEEMKRIFEGLREHFSKILSNNPNNFSDEVLQFLRKKLKYMQLKIGTLPRNATVTTMNSFYSELSLNENDFYGNHLKVLSFITKMQHARLRNAHNNNFLEDTIYESNPLPYYLPSYNMVVLPLTTLHLPFYHPQFHAVFKYSMIGFMLAHEITHAFDKSGVDFDEKGNMRDDFGEVVKENEIFDRHLGCLEAKNPNVIDEKIADISGLRWAYETYFANGTNSTQQLPWSKLTQEQLFFGNFAIFFCGDISKEDMYDNDPHGTSRSRLYDAVIQFGEFARAYNCHAGASMNPTRKCQLWR